MAINLTGHLSCGFQEMESVKTDSVEESVQDS